MRHYWPTFGLLAAAEATNTAEEGLECPAAFSRSWCVFIGLWFGLHGLLRGY